VKALYLTAALAPLLFAAPALAQTGANAAEQQPPRLTAWEASRIRANDDAVSTGVARARDRLDSATSTSSMPDADIVRIGESSIGGIFRTIPGIRAEAVSGEANNNYTIRGLPLVGVGSKYLQIQENGLPVLEFGDILGFAPDYFLRYDFNVAQIESIRGGSASTFASNSPGGVINLISHTGEVEGGSVQVSTGLDYENYRTDFSYGGYVSDTLRFHVGGFYREGEGPLEAGFNGNRGGQLKFNVTKEFEGGFFRVEGKLLDDRVIPYGPTPMLVTGTNDDPSYTDLPSFSVRNDTLMTGNLGSFSSLNGDGILEQFSFEDSNRVRVRSIGFQTRFNLFGWTIQEHMRFADQSGEQAYNFPLALVPAAVAPLAFGARPGSLAYATGPNAGQPITNLTGLNGNGLIALSTVSTAQIDSMDNFTNDLRASRVWNVGGGDLTTTIGVYATEQTLDFDRQYPVFFQDVVGGGRSARVDIINTNGTFRTQDGFLNFFGPTGLGSSIHYDVDYSILAPYGSVNYRTGPLSLGASVRFDSGEVNGRSLANGATDVRAIDVDGDGVLSEAERTFAFPAVVIPVGYDYDYTSWSVSANYRVAQNFSTFARYSSGGRAAAEKILRTVAIDPAGGGLTNPDIAYDPVDQAEIGFKFRTDGLFANLTGFWAEVSETNQQIRQGATGQTELALVSQAYKAIGAEFEGGIRRGPFSLTGSATWTSAEITDAADPALIGNTPRHQADVIYALLPQYDTDLFTVGASIVGTTESYSQDVNGLVMPAYTTVNAFLQVRPIERVVVSLNANNLFDELALVDVSAPTVPASGLSLVRVLPGRNVSAAVRFYF
jgi:outer membrane receptor protein involved in Fe transport